MKKIALVALFLSSTVNAAWQGYVYPNELLYEGDNSGSRAYIVFDKRFPQLSCKDKVEGNYIRIYGDTKKGQYFISTLLAAITSNKKVSPAISGCDDWGRPVLTGLRMSRK